jgi:hypothetical protein
MGHSGIVITFNTILIIALGKLTRLASVYYNHNVYYLEFLFTYKIFSTLFFFFPLTSESLLDSCHANFHFNTQLSIMIFQSVYSKKFHHIPILIVFFILYIYIHKDIYHLIGNVIWLITKITKNVHRPRV